MTIVGKTACGALLFAAAACSYAQVGNDTGFGSSVDRGLTVGGTGSEKSAPKPESRLGTPLRRPEVVTPPLPTYPNSVTRPPLTPEGSSGNSGVVRPSGVPPGVATRAPTTVDGALVPGASQYPVGSPGFSMGQ